MLAMQYRIPLPRGFDMGAIRARVADKAPAFDELPGLRFKAFLMAEAGDSGGSRGPGNEYATFYLWDSAAAAREFLLGERFMAVVRSFGRPRVETWLVAHAWLGAPGAPPAFALRETLPLPEGASLDRVAAAEEAEHARLAGHRGLSAWISAFDPNRWDGVRFSLWTDAGSAAVPGSANLLGWEVLHLSRPSRGAGDGAAPAASPFEAALSKPSRASPR